MIIYFVTNNKWYSKAHRFIAKEACTHVGFNFFDGSLDLIVDCTKPYGKVYHKKHWFDKYDYVYDLEIETTETEDFDLYIKTAKYAVLTPYDWGAYYYAWLMGLRKFLFGIPYPDDNKWSGKGLWCTEIMYSLISFLSEKGIKLWGYDFSVITPEMLYWMLAEYPQFKRCGNEYKKD